MLLLADVPFCVSVDPGKNLLTALAVSMGHNAKNPHCFDPCFFWESCCCMLISDDLFYALVGHITCLLLVIVEWAGVVHAFVICVVWQQ